MGDLELEPSEQINVNRSARRLINLIGGEQNLGKIFLGILVKLTKAIEEIAIAGPNTCLSRELSVYMGNDKPNILSPIPFWRESIQITMRMTGKTIK